MKIDLAISTFEEAEGPTKINIAAVDCPICRHQAFIYSSVVFVMPTSAVIKIQRCTILLIAQFTGEG